MRVSDRRINQILVLSEIHTTHAGAYQSTCTPEASRMFLGVKAGLPRC
jgi:hypothetical protein